MPLVRLALVVVTLCSLALVPLAVAQAEVPGADGGDEALRLYVRARLADADERVSDALGLYSRALDIDPENLEIRTAYAGLLAEVGYAESAVAVLETREDLDWQGKRLLGLSLAQVAMRDPQRLEDAEAALREALSERSDDPNLEINLAQVLLRSGRSDEGEAVLSELRSRRGLTPQLAALHASVLDNLGRNSEAIDLYRECADSAGIGPRCSERMSELLVEVGRLSEAAEVLEAHLEEDALDEILRVGRLYLDGDRPAKALEMARRVLMVEPEAERAMSLEAFALGGLERWVEAKESIRAMVDAGGEPNLAAELMIAWFSARSGDVEKARRQLEDQWTDYGVDPRSEDAWRIAKAGARVELAEANGAGARDWLLRGDAEGMDSEAFELLMASYRRDEAWRDALAALLRLGPGFDAELRLRAQATEIELRYRLDDDVQAGRQLGRLLEAEDMETLGMALNALQQAERWDRLVDASKSVLERYPGDDRIEFLLASALERDGRPDEAAEIFESMLEDDPANAIVANYLGYMWADAGVELERALELVTLAVEQDPNNAAYLDSLGWVFFRLGRLDEAELYLARAAEESSDGTILAHLGEVLFEMGRTEEAVAALKRALNIGADESERVRSILGQIESE